MFVLIVDWRCRRLNIWFKVQAFEYEIKETEDENKVFLLMEKGIEDDDANDDRDDDDDGDVDDDRDGDDVDVDAKTDINRWEGLDAVAFEAQTGEKPQPGQVENLIISKIIIYKHHHMISISGWSTIGNKCSQLFKRWKITSVFYNHWND